MPWSTAVVLLPEFGSTVAFCVIRQEVESVVGGTVFFCRGGLFEVGHGLKSLFVSGCFSCFVPGVSFFEFLLSTAVCNFKS
jgi:hypothetical protein